MATAIEYERIGRFIYSACRYGGDVADIHHWMADDLGFPRPTIDDQCALQEIYTAFFAKHASDDEVQANLRRFVEAMKTRKA